MNLDNLNKEELTELLKYKKQRLFHLKRDGFFKDGEFSRNSKYATLEAHRRRNEIKTIIKEIEERE